MLTPRIAGAVVAVALLAAFTAGTRWGTHAFYVPDPPTVAVSYVERATGWWCLAPTRVCVQMWRKFHR